MTSGDRPGGDYKNFVLPTDNVTLCEQACCDDYACMAWVYAASAPMPFQNCNTGDHCCYLKNVVPVSKPYPGLFNGVMNRTVIPAVPPPIGLRSAVPLGGIGAGAMELRGDGTFHEVTIVNQSPAGAAKFGVLGDAFLGLRTVTNGGSTTARTIRTTPPSYATGVSEILYSGAYPVSRLIVNDSDVPINTAVYAYSTLVPGNMIESAYPAVTFTLTASNPSSSAVTTSFFLNMPFGAINDCRRPSQNSLQNSSVTSYADCLIACSNTFNCASWSYNQQTGMCYLATDVPWSIHSEGWYCGVQGTWSSDNGMSINLIMHPSGGMNSPANGDITVAGVNDPSIPSSISVGVANDPSALWNSFSTTGTFVTGNGIIASGVFSNVTAGHGAAAVTTTLAPNTNTTLSIVFTWYFPNRDHMGEIIGNYYSTLWDNSAEVADALSNPSTLSTVVTNLNTHINVFSNPSSSLPPWIADQMVNQMSHFRGLIWMNDGRAREFEANDCPDVDSIHNDYQRHLHYLSVMPEFEYSKLRKWGSGQAKDGHIYEYLGSFGLGPIDVPGGRTMGDTTSLWVVEILEVWRHTADEDFLQEMWPIAKNAMYWQINNAAEIGLPWHLVCTYDIIDFDQYNTTTFNSFLHLAMMQAMIQMGTHLGDNQVVTDAQAAFTRGQNAINTYLWNSTSNYFRAYTGGDAIMADCLYGQVVAHHHGLGWLMPETQLKSHLIAELQYNGNPYGLTVVTGRHTPPPTPSSSSSTEGTVIVNEPTLRQKQAYPSMMYWSNRLGIDTQDDTNWMGAGPDWSYLAVTLGTQGPTGTNLTAALDPAYRSMENWRSRLHDLWNIAGLTSTGDWGDENSNGQPWITSHYGFLLVDYYLIFALNGQQTDIPNGKLSFNPVYACPFNLPLMMLGTIGTIECTNTNQYTVFIAFGSLQLPANGLSINGNSYNQPVNLINGQSVTWS